MARRLRAQLLAQRAYFVTQRLRLPGRRCELVANRLRRLSQP
jgi:hypothetical protein